MNEYVADRPRIRRHRGRNATLLICLLLIVVGGALLARQYFSAPGTAPATQSKGRGGKGKNGQPIPVTIAVAKSADVPVILTAIGTVQASNTVTISPMVTGPIVAINFKEGQDVAVGDVLARIDPRTFQATLDQNKAKLDQDQATLAGAQRDLARFNKLASTAYTPKQTAEDELATVEETKALVEQDRAQIESAQTELDYTTLTAPVAGRVGIRNVDLGNIVQAGTTNGIVTLTTLKPIAVVFTLPQQNLAAIQDAMAAGKPVVRVNAEGEVKAADATPTATTDPEGTPDSSERMETGTLDVVDNLVDSSTGTVKLKAYFPNEDLHLWPGGFVTARLTVKTLKGVVTVPAMAVQQGPSNNFVYVLGDDNKVTRKTVTLTQEDQTTAVIGSGVAAGDRVVLQGASQLDDGTKVRVVKPAAANGTAPATVRGGHAAKAAQP
ncbi:efflux RND transporter periplasmic adaptor subunit [Acidisoma sp. S159]|jgi:multidrug efflux system membrane fusion protein|uniref:efflux RND transporter periplasmic adaptor subunit n=1 Tax=Acidisoma sp. S159 TaxID=1747225 RepID=UPI00131C39CE|nr:efflux RND transporter periplasmic adaptor subunit [Acidisoma sp. S159]